MTLFSVLRTLAIVVLRPGFKVSFAVSLLSASLHNVLVLMSWPHGLNNALGSNSLTFFTFAVLRATLDFGLEALLFDDDAS